MRHRPAILVAMMATVIAGGCARRPDDAALASSIRLQLAADPMLKDADLGVSSSNGAVTLSGTVATDVARKEAFKLASQTRGVASVNDEMSVEVAQASQAFAPNADSPHPIIGTSMHTPREKKKGETTIEETASRDGLPRMLIPKTAPVPVISQFALQTATPQVAPMLAQNSVQAPALPTPPPASPAPPQPKDVVVPVNSMMRVRMIDTVDSAVNRPGEIFHAALESPMVVDGTVVVPRGTDIYVRLASSKKAGRLKGKSELHLELLKMEFQGRSYSLYSSTYSATGSSRGKETAKKVGSGAALGAIIGAIAGAGAGAAIGAGVGAGTGAVMTSLTKGKQVKIPSEAMLDFQLEQPVTVTVLARSSSTAAAQ